MAERATKVITSNILGEGKLEIEEQNDAKLSGFQFDNKQHSCLTTLFDVVYSLIFTKFSECNERKETSQSLFYSKTIKLAEALNSFEKAECSDKESKSDFYISSSSLFKPLCTLAVRFLSHVSYNMIYIESKS